MLTLYYHSKAVLDPKRRGKRMTVAAILNDTTLSFGISRGHPLDVKVWNKKTGRESALKSAQKKPVLTMQEIVEDKFKKKDFLRIAKNLVATHIRKDYDMNRFTRSLERRAMALDFQIESAMKELVLIEGFLEKDSIEIFEKYYQLKRNKTKKEKI